MSENPQNVIGVKEIADLMHISRRQFQRMVRSNSKPPGLIPPHRAPGRGSWFERDVMLRWIAKNKRPADQRHNLGRKRIAHAPTPTPIWQKQSAAVSKVPYNLLRSRRRVGCVEFVRDLIGLADSLARLPAVIGNVRARVRLQSESDAIFHALQRIRNESQRAVNVFLGR